jgi:S-adenosylmethionine/arginine decarboxylase-like enzyme
MQIDKDIFGKHLIMDVTLNEVNKDLLTDKDYVSKYIDEITKICGMQAVIPTIAMTFPFNSELHGFAYEVDSELKKLGINLDCVTNMMKYIKAKEENDTGVSAFSIWNTSHAAAHSWSEVNYISIDLYSCSDYDEKPVIEFSKQYFNLVEMRIVEVKRSVTEPQIVRQWSE